MAFWTQQLSRVGCLIQTKSSININSNWKSAFRDAANIKRTRESGPNNLPNHSYSRNILTTFGRPVPGWFNTIGNINTVYSALKVTGWTRTSDRNKGEVKKLQYDYVIPNNIFAQSLIATFIISCTGLFSHKGINHGAKRAIVNLSFRKFVRNNANGSERVEVLNYSDIRNDLYGWKIDAGRGYAANEKRVDYNLSVSGSERITRIILDITIDTGWEAYHSIGHRSYPAGWNPTVNIGSFYNYNLANYHHINERTNVDFSETVIL